MQASTATSRTKLYQLIMGLPHAQILHVAAVLGIADLLADSQRSAAELAESCGSHPTSLYRLLRALAALGVLSESAGRLFALTPVGQCLRSDSDESIRGAAILMGGRVMWNAHGDLLHSIRTGKTAFEHVNGAPLFDYLVSHREAQQHFDAAMTAFSAQQNAALLAAYDFPHAQTIVDVGGGHGRLLGAILAAQSSARGILFDLPSVVVGAEPLLRRAQVLERCALVSGDFFESVPEGGNLYLLKSIVHDWDDEKAARVLRNCRAAIPDNGRLLLIERVVGDIGETAETKLFDLTMLAITGGRERTMQEHGALLEATGFRLERVIPTEGPQSIIEARPLRRSAP